MTLENKHSQDFDGCWLRKASSQEVLFEAANNEGLGVLCYSLYLKSKAPLKEDQVRGALTHLYKKCPSLHFCFGKKDGETWIRRPTNPEVDFKVLEDKQLQETEKELFSYIYNSETGPLFCARLLLSATDALELEDDLEPSLPHSSYLLFGFHHSVGDGTSNSHTVGYFISLLNDVISGKPICDDEVLGDFVGVEYTEAVLEEHRRTLRADSQLDSQIAQEIDLFEETTSFVATHFKENNLVKGTHSLQHVFDQDTTKRFIKKCREEGVTVNSGFTTATSVALRDLLLEKGIICDSYRMKHYCAVNLRRYWKVKFSDPLGVHVGYPLQIMTDVPKNLGNNYWEYARSLHKSISNDISSKKSLFYEAHITLSSKSIPISHFVEKSVPVCTDLTFSNMGDITPITNKGGDEVKITHIIRSGAIHDLSKCFLVILCHTFRGKFTITFAYNASTLGRDFVQKFCDRTDKYMRI